MGPQELIECPGCGEQSSRALIACGPCWRTVPGIMKGRLNETPPATAARVAATAQMRRATRPITVYSGSMPLLKKKLRLGAKSSMCMPRARYASTKVKPLDKVNANWLMGLAPASAMW